MRNASAYNDVPVAGEGPLQRQARRSNASSLGMGRCQAFRGRRARRVQNVRPLCGRVVPVGAHLIMRSWPNTVLTPECIERYG